MTKQEANELKPQAKEYIRACNVTPLVYANEGGIMYLEDILVDFVRYLSLQDEKETKV